MRQVKEKKHVFTERACHGLNLYISYLRLTINKKIKVFINPNICSDVIETLNIHSLHLEWIDSDLNFHTDYLKLETALTNTYSINIFFYNCPYGYNKVDVQSLVNLKKKFPLLIIIGDFCLLNYDNYLKYRNLECLDFVIYSFGYSKFIDLHTGGIVSFNSDEPIDFRQFGSELKYTEWKKSVRMDSYPNNESFSPDLFDPKFIPAEEFEYSDFNKIISKKKSNRIKSQMKIRSALIQILPDFEKYMLPITSFDWRIHFQFSQTDILTAFIDKIENEGLYYSKHYRNKFLKNTPFTEAIVYRTVNLLENKKQKCN